MKNLILIIVITFTHSIQAFGQLKNNLIIEANEISGLDQWYSKNVGKNLFLFKMVNGTHRPVGTITLNQKINADKICIEFKSKERYEFTNYFISETNNPTNSRRFTRHQNSKLRTSCPSYQNANNPRNTSISEKTKPFKPSIDVNSELNKYRNLESLETSQIVSLIGSSEKLLSNPTNLDGKSRQDLLERKNEATRFLEKKKIFEELCTSIDEKFSNRSFQSEEDINLTLGKWNRFNNDLNYSSIKGSTKYTSLNSKITSIKSNRAKFVGSTTQQPSSKTKPSANTPNSLSRNKSSTSPSQNSNRTQSNYSIANATSSKKSKIDLSVYKELLSDNPEIWIGGVSIEFNRVYKAGVDEFQLGINQKQYDKLLAEGQASAVTFDNEIIPDDKRTISLGKSYFIGTYEVTNEQFKALVKNHKFDKSKAKMPATGVSIGDIKSFIDKLQSKIGKELGLEVDIPTEIEWEYAAKGEFNTRYPWGNKFKAGYANIQSNELKPVGSSENGKTWCGLFDMIGNATELCKLDKDNYGFITSSADKFSGRGGSFRSSESSSRVSTRHILSNTKDDHIGFRIVIRQK